MEEKEIRKTVEQQYPYNYYDDEIDLTELFKTLYKKRKFIISGVLGLTLLSIIICLILPKVYKTESFFKLVNLNNNNFTSVSPAIYRNYYGLFSNIERFKNYYKKYVNDKNLKKLLIKDTKSIIVFRKKLDKYITPVEANPKKREKLTSNVLGLNIEPEANSPTLAYKYALVLGDYIRNTIMYQSLRDYISDNYFNYLKNLKDIENKIIKINIKIKQLEEKKALLSKLLKSYPVSKKIDVTQIISIEKGGYNYLSPVLQIIGIESNLADLKTNLKTFQRDRTLTSLYCNFFEKLYKKMDDIKDGNKLFNIFKNEYNVFFKNKNLKDDIVKEVYNSITIQFNNYKQYFFEKIRFIAGPSIPNKPIKPKKRLIVAITFVTSLFLFIFLAFFVEWWENNKSQLREE